MQAGPDLGGVWTNAVEADLERPEGIAGLVVSREAYEASKTAGSKTINAFSVRNELHTSLIVDPPDGKMPFKDRASAMAWRKKYTVFVTGMGVPDPEFTMGPESLPNRDRCLMAANGAAPPVVGQGTLSAYQIVQTRSHVVIHAELFNETRIIPVFGGADEAVRSHRPSAIRSWTGDPVGWWDGPTLVVETVNIDARQGAQSPTPLSKDAKIVERFTRIDADEVIYQAEVFDPAIYTQPWQIESSWRPAPRVWEFACHEGNYGMAGILSGARKVERDAAAGGRSQ